MSRKPLIYLSSTFVDLESHRAAVKSALEKAQFDVESMEKYPAFDERPLKKCLVDVARADVYVLILAYRYGFRPRQDNPERRSITQLEYEEAGRHTGKPRLVFTIDPNHPWPPGRVDRGDDARDLEVFRMTVEERHGVNRFTDPNHLASVVQSALSALYAWNSLQETGRAQEPATWIWPRPWDFSGYVAHKRRGFVGRDWLFEKVNQWYTQPHGSQALLICADFGVGKSAFMAELTSGSRGSLIHAYHFCHHDTAETLNPAKFVQSIGAQLAAVLPGYRAAVENDPEAQRWFDEAQRDPASALERAVITPLNATPAPDKAVVLLVDALDEAIDTEEFPIGPRATTIVRILATSANRFPAWVRILVTSRRRREVLQLMHNAFRCEEIDAEDDRNLDDLRSYALTRFNSDTLSHMLAREGTTPSQLADLISSAEQSGGKFLYAVRVLNDIEAGRLSLNHLKELPPGMDAFYIDAFERRFPRETDYTPFRSLMGVLSLLREPMSRQELAAVLSTSDVDVRDMLGKLEDFLHVRNKRYSLDHLSLSQWLVQENERGFPRAGRFTVDVVAASLLLSTWARQQICLAKAHLSMYLARHVGSYLTADEKKSLYPRLLLDFDWLRVRLRAVGINVMLEDWAEVTTDAGLQSLERALRHGAHVLRRDDDDWCGPDLLASQILGRLHHEDRADEQVLAHLRERAAEYLQENHLLLPLTPSLQTTEALLRTLQGHLADVIELAVLPDGRLVSGSLDGTIKVWSPSDGVCIATLEVSDGPVLALAVLPDGRLAFASWDKTIQLWDLASQACEATLAGHLDTVRSIVVLVDGRIVSASTDRTIRVWSRGKRSCVATLEGHTDSVTALAVLPNARLASCSRDGTIRLWDTSRLICEATLHGHTEWVIALAALPDGRLASGSEDSTIRLWNLTNNTCEAILDGHTYRVCSLAVLPGGRLISGSVDATIKLWNLSTAVCEATFEGHGGSVESLAVLRDGSIASGSEDHTIKLWKPTGSASKVDLDGHDTLVQAFATLPYGRVASGSSDESIKLWNSANGVCEATFVGYEAMVYALALTHDHKLAVGLWGGRIEICNLSDGRCEIALEAHTNSVTALALLPDGGLASASLDKTIRLWNPSTGVLEHTLQGHTGPLGALTVLLDGRLASGSDDCTIKLWDLRRYACEATLEGHTDRVNTLAILPDGRLASGSNDCTIKLWDLTRRTRETTLEGHTHRVNALAVLPDGRLASASEDKTVRIWTIQDRQIKGTVQFVADAGIEALALVPDTLCLVAGDRSGHVHCLKCQGVS